MKKTLLKAVFCAWIMASLASCSSETTDDVPVQQTQLVNTYNYSDVELELAKEINDYRISKGLNALETINHISYKSEEHNEYMIANKVVNHDFFEERAENLIELLGAVKVNENVAYNYTTPAGVLHAWLQSESHKANIEGDFTHFGISVTEDPETGKKYYTNIFIKK